MTSGRPKEPGRADGLAPTPSAARAVAPGLPSGEARPISSDALFAGATEVQIAHRGSLYRLKQTSLGKLILTK